MLEFSLVVTVPDKKMGCCLDPELPGTGLRGGGGGQMQGRAAQFEREESVGTQQRWGKSEDQRPTE